MAKETPAASLKQEHVERVHRHLSNAKRDGAGIEDVVALAEVSADSLKSFFSDLDHKICAELGDIVSYIDTMRSEIAGLGAKKLKESQIPEAGKELDTVVQSTADATNKIMTIAEDLMSADTSDHEAYVAQVNDAVMNIFEACSFQDLTGQRIAKVVETLQQVEARLTRFTEVLRIVEGEGVDSEEIQAKQARKEALILHGPQFEDEAMKQDAIDALLNSEESPEDVIARLFA